MRRIVSCPAFSSVCSRGLIIIFEQTHLVADRKICSVQVKEMFGEWPVELQTAGHFGPKAVADNERVFAYGEWRVKAEFSAP
jgi:hypothetical protein